MDDGPISMTGTIVSLFKNSCYCIRDAASLLGLYSTASFIALEK